MRLHLVITSWKNDQGAGDGTPRLSRNGLTFEMWKVGWIRMARGSLSLTTAGLTTFSITNGPMNLGANLLDSTLSGRFWVESHTFWPTR